MGCEVELREIYETCIIYRYNSSMKEHSSGHLPLHKAFFAPFRIIEEGGIDPILRGLYGTAAKMPSSSQVFNEELTEKLFKLAHAVALGKPLSHHHIHLSSYNSM